MTVELASIIDFIRYGASRFNAAGLCFGHSHDNALDEATHLVLNALHLPPDLPPVYGAGKLTRAERESLLRLIERRVVERKPVAYLTGEAWFAGLAFQVDERVLVPRSPIAELIQNNFEPWLDGKNVENALDLCTGSGCIAIALAVFNPSWRVDATDISEGALELARRNAKVHNVAARVRVLASDLFESLGDRRYDLIVSNPPYVTESEYAELPREYAFEPALGLKAGSDGLDFALRILAEAPEHMNEDGLLIVEVGEAEHALAGLLPEVPFCWIEFAVGPMGVFALEYRDLVTHAAEIKSVLAARKA